MSHKAAISLAFILILSLSYLYLVSDKLLNQPAPTAHSSSDSVNEEIKDQNIVSTNIDSSEIAKPIESRAQDMEQKDSLLSDLVEIYGEGEVIPIKGKEAQERLFEKIGSNETKRLVKKYNESDYDPKYDTTWQSDMQSKSIDELHKHFAQDVFVESYNCTDASRCTLKISQLKSALLPTSEVVNYMQSLRDTPAIMQSGMSRDVYLSHIGFDANGNFVAELEIGESDENLGSNQ